jgi:hypothetical protein
MAITLNHTIVPARDKSAAAQFFARIFGLHADPKGGHFAPVRINDTLTGRVGLSCGSLCIRCRGTSPSPGGNLRKRRILSWHRSVPPLRSDEP